VESGWIDFELKGPGRVLDAACFIFSFYSISTRNYSGIEPGYNEGGSPHKFGLSAVTRFSALNVAIEIFILLLTVYGQLMFFLDYLFLTGQEKRLVVRGE
jgi:hypothetical protein